MLRDIVTLLAVVVPAVVVFVVATQFTELMQHQRPHAPAPVFPAGVVRCANAACGAAATWLIWFPVRDDPLPVCLNCSVLSMVVAMSCGAYPEIEPFPLVAPADDDGNEVFV